MKGKRKATSNDSELSSTQPSLKRVRQADSLTSSMANPPQRTPVAGLVASIPFYDAIYLNTNKFEDDSLAYALWMLFETVYKDTTWKGALDDYYLSRDNCSFAIKEKHDLAEECRKSMESKDWESVFAWLEQEKVGRQHTPARDGVGIKSAQFAWEVNFVGNAHEHLLSEMQAAAKRKGLYCTITPIVQSSGMGKSRTVDELAKCVFTIPICLRDPKETGYPLGDEDLWDFFKGRISADEAQRLCIELLRSIMREIAKEVKSKKIIKKLIAGDWYERLKPPNGTPSPVRKKLYKTACKNLDLSGTIESARESLKSEFRTLANLVATKAARPRVIIYIDECHYLSEIDTTRNGKKRNCLDAMLHAIELCGEDGLFGITLSTNSSFRELSPRAEEFKSDRELAAQQTRNARPVPFTSLPFDCWNGTPIVIESKSKFSDVCTLEFAARFGRFLWWTRLTKLETRADMLDELVDFAAQKLTLNGGGKDLSEAAKFAALSARLWLRLNTSLDPVRSLQDKLVESHMSVAYHIPDHKHYMYSGHPSEPILMEGAAHVWNSGKYPDFKPLDTLQNTLTEGFLAKGERGELVGRYICLRAQDICIAKGGPDLIGDKRSYARAVPLLSFLKAMFGPQWENIRLSKARNRTGGKNLETACRGKYVRFTHFAKAGDASALSTAAGWKALARANAWQCFDRQEGVDLGVPVFVGNPEDGLCREAVTWILIQIKNSSYLQAVHFSAESLGIFNDRKSTKRTPYFVLVFQFSVKAPSKTAATRTNTDSSMVNVPTSNSDPPTPPQKIKARRNEDVSETSGTEHPVDKRDPAPKAHPCYWIDVIGCSSKVFNSEIVPDNFNVVKQLLASRDVLDDAKDKKAAILQLKPFFEAGPASYAWAADDEIGVTPGTMGYADEEGETVKAVEAVEGEACSDDDEDETVSAAQGVAGETETDEEDDTVSD
ncbi:hypothetical protein BD410DRAFT_826146 [Rickenella mellea]|uniref:Uncharacterized protein n=1 Tax=Rickenella mellea TaxID=50990 RepID=A0A4Y7QGK4_9AGAM|nr:hypothetical protein BD410DRAFT_826146 [Rickenella mellea]